jgi:hypothetical protein
MEFSDQQALQLLDGPSFGRGHARLLQETP